MSMRFRINRPDGVREFEFDRDRVTVGRGPSNDVVSDDAEVARLHGTFELDDSGQLLWKCEAATTLHRGGAQVDRGDEDQPRAWSLHAGDEVRIDGSQIAIEVLGADASEQVVPHFIELEAAADAAAPVLVRLAEDLANGGGAGAILSAFDALLEQRGLAGGSTTFVVLTGPDEYHNDVWAVSEHGCRVAPDPTSVLGVAADAISTRWKEEQSVALVGNQLLVPFGAEQVEAVLVHERDAIPPHIARDVAAAASSLRPFSRLFVDRLHDSRQRRALHEENRYFRARQRQHYLFKELICESARMRSVHERLQQLCAGGEPVLFAGEAGTGKELLARLLHHESHRRNQMIMRVNCAEFANETANFELFGASADDDDSAPRQGVFELARAGTVLLEEVDLLPPMVQAKLCRALKENEVRRVGESVGRPVRSRVVACIHRDVSVCVAEGRLRRDLYLLFRDQTITVPALRERREDILPLAREFLSVYASRYGREIEGFTAGAENCMLEHFWPGNVRELQARIEASVLGTRTNMVGVGHLGLG